MPLVQGVPRISCGSNREFPSSPNSIRSDRSIETSTVLSFALAKVSKRFAARKGGSRERERERGREGEQVAENIERKMRTCRYLDQTRLKSSWTRIG